MSLSVVAKYLLWTYEIKKINFASVMQYRFTFIVQILAMFFNDAALLLIWAIFFKKFPQINGWGFDDTLLLFAISWFGFSLIAIFAAGIMELAPQITKGDLDYYLLSPSNILWNISVSKSRISDLGTLILSIIMLGFVLPFNFTNIFLFLILSTISAVIIFNFCLIINSLAFYFGQIDQLADFVLKFVFYIIYYPQSIFTWPFKLVTTFIIPVFFIGTLPMQLLKEFNLSWFFILIAFTIVSTIFAIKFFYAGLRRYESGNLLNIKL